ncbi:MAG: tRNA pseudouridine(38-40) synthase TruA [Alphaproteobacteria bacterium]|nr:MAG: tRNA pseudouridine(38-40) synthase TruA [Alphaproteobacteria bacterium]
MNRYKIIIEYDGTPFVGWQRQNNGTSVQGCLEEAIYKFCQERVTVTGAGRTDAGVHALSQVAHFDCARDLDSFKISEALNFHLHPHPIAILGAEKVDENFHARFSAKERSYIYRIVNRRAPLAVDRNRAWQIPLPLDAEAMQQAAQHLVGTHDFSTFRDSECQAKSPIKTLHEISVARDGENISVFVRAPSFLHHMVRNITGSLVQVGLGKWGVENFIRVRDAKDRKVGGPTAPPDGLYFLKVSY